MRPNKINIPKVTIRKVVILIAAIAALAAYVLTGKEARFPLPNLENGDIVFRKENSFWGDLSSAAARIDGRYSHSGIIYIEHGEPFVIHAYADTNKHEAKVNKQPLDQFLSNASAAGFYRLNFTPEIREEVAKKALDYYNRGTPFDDKFSLDDDKAVYCTELVWRSAKAASGYDIAPIKSTLMKRPYIGTDDLFMGGFMTELKK